MLLLDQGVTGPGRPPSAGTCVVIGAATAVLLGIYIQRHPLHEGLLLDFALFSAPQPAKLGRILRSLAALALVDVAALAIGRWIGRRLVPPELCAGLRWLIALALGFVVLGWGTLALGVAGWLSEPALLLLLVAPIIASAPLWLRWWRARRQAAAAAAPAAEDRRRRPPWWLWTAAGVLLLPAFLDAFVPSYGWDALTYHLALPERFLREGRISMTPFSTYSAFPHAIHMLYTLALGIDGPALAKLLNLQMGVAALIALFLLGDRLSRRCALLAVAILMADPLFQWELTSAYTDLSVVFYALLAFAALAEWSRTRGRTALLLTGVLAGACTGVRLPAIAVPIALALAAFVPEAQQGFAWPGRAEWLSRARAAASVTVVASAMFLPWLVRNVAFTGNPFTPAAQGLFHRAGQEYFDPFVIAQQIDFTRSVGMGRGLLALVALPWNLPMNTRPGMYADGFGQTVGLLQWIGTAAALALPQVRARPLVRTALVVTALFTLLWFVGSQEARYLLPIFPLAALAAAAAFDSLAGPGRSGRSALLVLPVVALLYGVAPAFNRLGHEWGYAAAALSPDRLEAAEPAHRVATALRRTLSPSARLLLIFEGRSYLFRGLDHIPYHVDIGSPVLRMIHHAPDDSALRCRLAALGVTHLVVNSNQVERHPTFRAGYGPAQYAADVARLRGFLVAWSEPLVQDRGVVAVTLRPPPPGCSPAPAPR